ncbi:MAG: hypothetical protein IKA62_04050 [Clostridia bacterium]|nr:hypothetical protein [Clostridia bacterium]
MEDAQIVLERHEQRLRAIEQDISDLKAVQTEIRTMNETLVTLATELKHTNEHLKRHEHKIDAIERQPRVLTQQIVTAIIAALAGGLISTVIGMIFA